MRETITGAGAVVRIGCTAARWHAIDRMRRGGDRIRARSAYALAAGRRIIRLGPPKMPKRGLNVTVYIHFGQDNKLESQRIAA